MVVLVSIGAAVFAAVLLAGALAPLWFEEESSEVPPNVARVEPCSCGYWEGEDPDSAEGVPMARYDSEDGLLSCVECGDWIRRAP